MTLELGRIMTCRLPAFSALLMAFSASFSTLVLTMMVGVRDSQLGARGEVSALQRAALAWTLEVVLIPGKLLQRGS